MTRDATLHWDIRVSWEANRDFSFQFGPSQDICLPEVPGPSGGKCIAFTILVETPELQRAPRLDPDTFIGSVGLMDAAR